MKKVIYGSTSGLKNTQIKAIERLYSLQSPAQSLASEQLLSSLVEISHEIRRQIGLLIDRKGKVVCVMAGDAHEIMIPDTPDFQAGPGKLKGLRCVHTHLQDQPLTQDDLTDLALLRLDYMAAVCISPQGFPDRIYTAHILPNSSSPCEVLSPLTMEDLPFDYDRRIQALETELARDNALHRPESGRENAFLIHAAEQGNAREGRSSLEELKELCKTSQIQVVGTALQQRKKMDPKFVVGKGKLSSLIIQAMGSHATMLIFDTELTPAQMRSITDFVQMKVIDRTQLILDIFANQAKSREGKFQVELAQLEYLLPRLITKNTAMSRLTGGIGGRGPGETKLEINRRRVHERIVRLKKEIQTIRKQRDQQKSRRKRKNLPIISIVGYTNAGKSTLLNTMTQSKILAANRLFATLDPSSRRLRFPRDTEVIITDTVGFIRHLPEALVQAFHATLAELADADILLHVIDISNPRHPDQKKSVESILKKLNLDKIPTILVCNKQDRVDMENFEDKWLLNQGFCVSARDKQSLVPLIEKLESMLL